MKSDKNRTQAGFNIITGDPIRERVATAIRSTLSTPIKVEYTPKFTPKPKESVKDLFGQSSPQRPMTSQSIDFSTGINAKQIKSMANLNAFDGLNAINDETQRIRERKKKERECLNNNVDMKSDRISIKANVIKQVKDNEINNNQFKNDAIQDKINKQSYESKKLNDEYKRNLAKQLQDKEIMKTLENDQKNELRNNINLENKKQNYGSGFLFDDREQQKQRSLKQKETLKFNNQEQQFKFDKKNMIQKDDLNSEKLCPFDGQEHNQTPKINTSKTDQLNQLKMAITEKVDFNN